MCIVYYSWSLIYTEYNKQGKKYNMRQANRKTNVWCLQLNCIRAISAHCEGRQFWKILFFCHKLGWGWPMQVAILGAGMGGSALALWLRRSQQFRLWCYFSALCYCLPAWFCNQWLQLDFTSWDMLGLESARSNTEMDVHVAFHFSLPGDYRGHINALSNCNWIVHVCLAVTLWACLPGDLFGDQVLNSAFSVPVQ